METTVERPKPDAPITEIIVLVHTADVADAGTDNFVHLRLFNPSPSVSQYVLNDTDDKFERKSKDTIKVKEWFFKDRIVNDITMVQLYKNADNAWGGWGLGKIEVKVNGYWIYSSPEGKPLKWLEDDDRHWTAPDFNRIVFEEPSFPDQTIPAEPFGFFNKEVVLLGGKPFAEDDKPPFDWKLESSVVPKSDWPTVQTSKQFPRRAFIVGKAGPDHSTWPFILTVTDALGKSCTRQVVVLARSVLDPPGISGFDVDFGWRAAGPSAPGASMVKVLGTNFDIRPGKLLKAFFAGKDGSKAEAQIVTADGQWLHLVIPDGAVTGKVEVETQAGKAASVDDVVVHSSGYRFRDGFQFTNTMTDDNDDGFPNTFAWERYEEAYGVDGMWVMSLFGGVVPDPFSVIFYLVTKNFIDIGCCHGFGLESLRIREGIVGDASLPTLEDPYPLDGTLFDKAHGADKPSGSLSERIQVGQLAMMSAEALWFYIKKLATTPRVDVKPTTMDARPMAADISDELGRAWADPRMIAFAKGASPFSGHVVVPYRMEVMNSVAKVINVHVYNPNFPVKKREDPEDPHSHFEIDPLTGNWKLDMKSSGIWNGCYCFSIPLSVYGHNYYWTIISPFELLDKIGYFGSCTGGPGTVVEPIEGAMSSAPTAAPRPMHGLTGKKARFRVTSDASAANPGMVAIMLETGEALSVEEVRGSILVELDLATKRIAVHEESLGSEVRPVVRLVRRGNQGSLSRTYALRAAKGVPKGTVGLNWAGSHPTAAIGVRAADLYSRRLDSLGRDTEVELPGLAGDRVHERQLAIGDDGALSLLDGSGQALDLAGATRFQSHLDVMVPEEGGPFTVALKEAGRLAKPIPSRVRGGVSDVRGSNDGRRPPIGLERLVARTGTHVTMVAEQRDGYRAFPRPVMVSRQEKGKLSHSPFMFLAETPGLTRLGVVRAGSGPQVRRTTCTVPIILVTDRAPVTAATIKLTRWVRVCGDGLIGKVVEVQPNLPDWLAAEDPADARSRGLVLMRSGFAADVVAEGFDLSPEMVGLGAKVEFVPSEKGGLIAAVSWSANKPQSGRVALGSLRMSVPDAPGSIWVGRGGGSVHAAGGADFDARLVSIEVRCLGDKVPQALSLSETNPNRASTTWIEVGEGETKILQIKGWPQHGAPVGWWVTSRGGRAVVEPLEAGQGKVKGTMAGAIRVHALVGEDVIAHDVLVTPRVGWSALHSGNTVPPKDDVPRPPGRNAVPDFKLPWELLRDRHWNPPDILTPVDLGRRVIAPPEMLGRRGS